MYRAIFTHYSRYDLPSGGVGYGTGYFSHTKEHFLAPRSDCCPGSAEDMFYLSRFWYYLDPLFGLVTLSYCSKYNRIRSVLVSKRYHFCPGHGISAFSPHPELLPTGWKKKMKWYVKLIEQLLGRQHELWKQNGASCPQS